MDTVTSTEQLPASKSSVNSTGCLSCPDNKSMLYDVAFCNCRLLGRLRLSEHGASKRMKLVGLVQQFRKMMEKKRNGWVDFINMKGWIGMHYVTVFSSEETVHYVKLGYSSELNTSEQSTKQVVAVGIPSGLSYRLYPVLIEQEATGVSYAFVGTHRIKTYVNNVTLTSYSNEQQLVRIEFRVVGDKATVACVLADIYNVPHRLAENGVPDNGYL